MDQKFIDYHAAMLINKLFVESSTNNYLGVPASMRVDVLSDIATEYCSVFEINKANDFDRLKGETQLFVYYLLKGEQEKLQ